MTAQVFDSLVKTNMAKSSSVTKSSRSGGPQTDEGKKIASQNALKTGAYSNTLILPGEDESQFRQIEDQFVRDFRPEDMAEIAMVRDLAVLALKKIRLENLELRFTLARLDAPLSYSDKINTEYLSSDQIESSIPYLSDYTVELKSEAVPALDYAKQLQARGATVEDLEGLEESCHILHQKLVESINHYEFTNSTAKNVLRYEIENDDGEAELFWDYFLRETIKDLGQTIWLCEVRPKIEQELQVVKDKRLMELMENEKPSRAFNDLRRNFYRTLSELRKHQEWKRKMLVVDVASRNVVDSGEEGGSEWRVFATYFLSTNLNKTYLDLWSLSYFAQNHPIYKTDSFSFGGFLNEPILGGRGSGDGIANAMYRVVNWSV